MSHDGDRPILLLSDYRTMGEIYRETTPEGVLMLNLDIYQLFIALLTTALLQEFAIKPSVEFLKKHLKRLHKKMNDTFVP